MLQDKHGILLWAVGFFLLFSMFSTSIILLVFYNIDNLSGVKLSNTAILASNIIVCMMIYVSVALDKARLRTKRLFLALIFFLSVLLYCSFVAVTADGHPEYSQVVHLSRGGYYIITYLFVYLFWRYILTDMEIDDRVVRILDKVMLMLVSIALVVIITNYWTGYVFTVEDGCYVRGSLIILSTAPIGIMGILCTVTAYKYNNERHSRNAEMVFVLLPSVAFVGQFFFKEYMLFPIALFFTLMLYYGNFYYYMGRELVKKDKVLTEQRFASMYSQIQPHFLYNSLTSIMNLPGNTQETRDAIAEFGKYLRGNLDSLSRKHPIQLRMELSHVETYVGLEKMRFKEKLNVEYDIQDVAYFLPALSLQMMVENAIRHGITMREEGGTVRIRSIDNGVSHILTVEDNGVGFDMDAEPDDDAPHCGIINTRRCIEELGGTLDIISKPSVGTKVTIRIPKKEQTQK